MEIFREVKVTLFSVDTNRYIDTNCDIRILKSCFDYEFETYSWFSLNKEKSDTLSDNEADITFEVRIDADIQVLG